LGPLIATWLVSVTGNPLAPAFYVMTGAAISTVAVLTMKEHLNTPLD
jgi:MHS family proline/betaine transporter-like MFS transporter